MKDNKLIKLLIPLIAAVVVFESIILVTNLEKSNKVSDSGSTSENSGEVVETVVEEPIMDFAFSTDDADMQVGKTYKISLSLTPRESKMIDGIETYIKYDIDALKVSELLPGEKMPKPEISKIDTENGIVSNVVLIDDEAGFSLTDGEKIPVLTFNVTPKMEGQYIFKLITSSDDKDHASLVVENSVAKSLPWISHELTINVTK